MKSDCESNDNLRIAVRYLPALAVVPSTDVAKVFWILADCMPEHEEMPELLMYFEHTGTYIRGRRRREPNECYRSTIYPIKHEIVLKAHWKESLKPQTQSKVGIADCKHYFSVVTQRYRLLLKD